MVKQYFRDLYVVILAVFCVTCVGVMGIMAAESLNHIQHKWRLFYALLLMLPVVSNFALWEIALLDYLKQRNEYLRRQKIIKFEDLLVRALPGLTYGDPINHKPFEESKTIQGSYDFKEHMIYMRPYEFYCDYCPITRFWRCLSTLFHEAGHATGHPLFLNRDIEVGYKVYFGNEEEQGTVDEKVSYAKEEIVAILTSANLLTYFKAPRYYVKNTREYEVSYYRRGIKEARGKDLTIDEFAYLSEQAEMATKFILAAL